MAESFPAYLVGRNHKNVFVYPLSLALGTGAGADTETITIGSGVDLAAGQVFDEFEIEDNSGLVEISPTTSGMENYVSTKKSFTATLTAIRLADGTNPVDTLAATSLYCKILVNTSADGTTVGQCDSVLGIIDTRSRRSDVGKNTVSISVRPIGFSHYTGSSDPYTT